MSRSMRWNLANCVVQKFLWRRLSGHHYAKVMQKIGTSPRDDCGFAQTLLLQHAAGRAAECDRLEPSETGQNTRRRDKFCAKHIRRRRGMVRHGWADRRRLFDGTASLTVDKQEVSNGF